MLCVELCEYTEENIMRKILYLWATQNAGPASYFV